MPRQDTSQPVDLERKPPSFREKEEMEAHSPCMHGAPQGRVARRHGARARRGTLLRFCYSRVTHVLGLFARRLAIRLAAVCRGERLLRLHYCSLSTRAEMAYTYTCSNTKH